MENRRTGGSGNRQGGVKPKKDKTKSSIATAPYNFISLPERILPSPLDGDRLREALRNIGQKEARTQIHKIYGEYLKKASNDGYIDLTLKTLTPFFLGAGAETYAPTGVPIIPGSSIRGMVKNLFKIITLGAMRPDEDFAERRLYYRCMMPGPYAWGIGLNKEYAKRMTTTSFEGNKRTVKKNARPGFLAKRGEEYVVYPMTSPPKRVLIHIYERKYGDKIAPNMKDVRVEWHGDAAYAISGSQERFKLCKTEEEYRQKVAQRRFVGKQFVKEYLLSAADWENPIKIDKKAIQEYRDDKNRRGVDLLSLSSEAEKGGAIKGNVLCKNYSGLPKEIQQIAPCYYLSDAQGNVNAFGHGDCFRIPYRNSIAKCVSPEIKKDTVDFADAMFGLMRAGDKAAWSSRVFFEDARLDGDVFYEEPHRAHPLSSPNPTSYQLYLKQPYKEGQREWGDLNHWDSDNARIRGYKLYWHNAKPDAWHASDEEAAAIDMVDDKGNTSKDEEKQLTRKIMPVKKGTLFSARIRFSSLRPEELGALLMVFHMEQAKNIAYKLGKGKAIGLGSVCVAKCSLHLNDTEQYKKLFSSESSWNDPCAEEADKTSYLEAFKKYIGDNGMENTWQHVMGELAAMLEWRNGWDEGKVSEAWETATKEMRATYTYKEDKQKWETAFNDGFLRRDVLLPLREVLKEAGVTP